MRKKGRSELENFVLGLVWQMGPCSPYEVRRAMQASPSTQWSGSAGAIYPLVARLAKQGLLKGVAKRNGRRGRKEYVVTATGIRSMRAWIGPPFSPETATVSYDPLRSRARFLGLLSGAEKREWVAAARRVLDDVEKSVIEWERRTKDVGVARAVMTCSGVRDVTCRREWLGDVEELMLRTRPRRLGR